MSKMRVEVVSTEQLIFSGEAEFVVAPATEGEIGVYPQHVPLLTRIKPGVLRLKVPGTKEEVLVAVSGGMMEVQPSLITVLADTAIRGEDLDEARANEAKRAAEDALKHATDDMSTAKAHAALAVAIAELKTLDYLKKRAH
ncbi:F0F1 ATP synthase subunit epsilon [Chromobacterium violaceum]|uniref:ATP synthase epsilon chain n=1 Tax=Chromobacterium violaceum (strain ATCC 12472 / DSM 30191 / JCM 1249 / CCUG 213 / NBRC 12614 / NCIMB 9131 / NCTC 9757 / MK) TaxID=243365 RepID=ATPE_CHRVO|nr:F0F1 ATP synthase subunit epsilon [Chromobacterium violaceum]Q7P094.1 RecName: Full=ATP synthase epsilon chain; AltName: Full=ATP synthase F1 sector epsilon subunit; AltName: Full=F-ATPase epsilon subunit [Chromobacterium violaceum ATCC 12472]AAQ58349.1 H+-transporting two-sector ATPase, epsilon subunit [Chromobacterium violaceum ATCC 12472]ATP27476.1 ATP synthase epsilon chain [Chromobacterium violaceum]ATP31393.1 ATP synthase epsilon chain [Chromobacterium violaceum]KJH68951.1 ATP synthas